MVDALRPFASSEAAEFLASPLSGNPDLVIDRAVTADRIAPGAVAFVKDYARLHKSAATPIGEALIIGPSSPVPPLGWTVIRTPEPRLAFARILKRFFEPPTAAGIHPSAVVHETAKVAASATVGPSCVIGASAVIGPETVLRNNVTIGRGVVIGARCLIKSSTVIGEEGFGIARDEQGNTLRIPHLGSVRIGDDVEIGALNTICSGTVEPTLVGNYVKTDDHIHIAHNCVIGANSIITASAELSGSVVVGERVWIGPNACLMNGIRIGDDTMIGLGAVVTKELPSGVVAAGNPARVLRQVTKE
jgi:UDP-3-O-[3-hydroxymyristoyl] glucosamine N-acyltransferase